MLHQGSLIHQCPLLAQALHANSIFFLKCTQGSANNLGAKARSKEDESAAEKLSKCSSSVEELTGVPSPEHFLMGTSQKMCLKAMFQ